MSPLHESEPLLLRGPEVFVRDALVLDDVSRLQVPREPLDEECVSAAVLTERESGLVTVLGDPLDNERLVFRVAGDVALRLLPSPSQ